MVGEAISHKKRTYRMEIRKRQLQNVFDKVRKPAIIDGHLHPFAQQYSNSPLTEEECNQQPQQQQQQQQQQFYNQQTPDVTQQQIQTMNHTDLKNELARKTQLFGTLEKIAQQTNMLNTILHNFNNLTSADQIEKIVSSLFQEYLNQQAPEEIVYQLKQVFLHMSLLAIVKHAGTNINSKNIALWCLINLTSEQEDPFAVVDKLVKADVIPLLMTLLKDLKYSLLYENIMWLAINIALDHADYRYMFIETGFVLYVNNFLQQIAKGFSSQVEKTKQGSPQAQGIHKPFLLVILRFCVALLNMHQKMPNEQFIVINSIMDVCLKTNKSDLFEECVRGMLNLFEINNQLTENQFNILFESAFFSQFFIMCTQNDTNVLEISCLFRHLSLLSKKQVLMLAKQDLCMPIYLLLDHPLKQVRQDMVFSLSNFLLNGEEFVAIASQMSLNIKIIVILERECWEIQSEALYALASLLESQDVVQKEEFLQNRDMMSVVCQFFNQNYEKFNDEMTEKMLDCLIFILDFGEYATTRDTGYENNPFYIAIECNSTVPTIEHVIDHGSKNNAMRAQQILDNYSWTRASDYDEETEFS